MSEQNQRAKLTMRQKIEDLIFNEEQYTAYSIAKNAKVAQSTISKLRNRQRKIELLSFENAEKLATYWDKINTGSDEQKNAEGSKS